MLGSIFQMAPLDLLEALEELDLLETLDLPDPLEPLLLVLQ